MAGLLDPEAVSAHAWVLEQEDGSVLAPFLFFLPEGRVGGAMRDGLRRWQADGRGLCFFDRRGAPTLRLVARKDGEPLAGTCKTHGAVRLRRLPVLPPHRLHLPTPARPRPGRRNLVLLRAGPGSLHSQWRRDLAEADRSWDLCLSWYGPADALPTDADGVVPGPGTKFEGLAGFIATQPWIWDYDYVWLPDDDLMTGWADINLLFGLCAEYDLLLAQPSLAPGSHVNQPITGQIPHFLLRFTSFVEIMAPVFAAAALRLCAPTFAMNRTGYGLDHVWPRLIGAPTCRIAVIDAVGVVHTRPLGTNYDVIAALSEGMAVQQSFGQLQRYQVFGGVFARSSGYVKLRNRPTDPARLIEGAAADLICA